MPEFIDLRAGYRNLWDRSGPDSHRVSEIRNTVQKIINNKDKYRRVEEDTTVPWFWVACVHYRESTLNFGTHLHNGQPLNKRTTITPKGRGPFNTFAESAIDAIRLKKLHTVKEWTVERCLYEWERYNGWGYFGRENSPYVWAGTTQSDEVGKYIRDGVYDPNAPEVQLGCAALLHLLVEMDEDVRAYLFGTPVNPPQDSLDTASVDELVRLLLAKENVSNVVINYSNSSIGISSKLPSLLDKLKGMDMNKQMLGQIRHVLTTVGGILVAFGFLSPDEVTMWGDTFDKIAGPALILWGAVWSWLAPEKK